MSPSLLVMSAPRPRVRLTRLCDIMDPTANKPKTSKTDASSRETHGLIAALYTRQDVADKLAVSLRTVDSLLASGKIRFCRIGGAIRFKPEWLDELISQNEVVPEPKAPRASRRTGFPSLV